MLKESYKLQDDLEDKVKYQLMSYISQFKAIKDSDIDVMIDLMTVIRENQDLPVEEIYEMYVEILAERI